MYKNVLLILASSVFGLATVLVVNTLLFTQEPEAIAIEKVSVAVDEKGAPGRLG